MSSKDLPLALPEVKFVVEEDPTIDEQNLAAFHIPLPPPRTATTTNTVGNSSAQSSRTPRRTQQHSKQQHQHQQQQQHVTVSSKGLDILTDGIATSPTAAQQRSESSEGADDADNESITPSSSAASSSLSLPISAGRGAGGSTGGSNSSSRVSHSSHNHNHSHSHQQYQHQQNNSQGQAPTSRTSGFRNIFSRISSGWGSSSSNTRKGGRGRQPHLSSLEMKAMELEPGTLPRHHLASDAMDTDGDVAGGGGGGGGMDDIEANENAHVVAHIRASDFPDDVYDTAAAAAAGTASGDETWDITGGLHDSARGRGGGGGGDDDVGLSLGSARGPSRYQRGGRGGSSIGGVGDSGSSINDGNGISSSGSSVSGGHQGWRTVQMRSRGGDGSDGEWTGGNNVGIIYVPVGRGGPADSSCSFACKQYLSFAGMGLMIAVGYMDPGNWQTDLEAGVRHQYKLLWVVGLASLVGMVFQYLSVKLGIAAELDLARACRVAYSPRVSRALWVAAEIGIIATDIAGVVGAAIALKMLFGTPLLLGLFITVLDVLLILMLEGRAFRLLEMFVGMLSIVICIIFTVELGYSKPNGADVFKGFIPSASTFASSQELFIATSILGATVMPHNLYLHSSVVQTRGYPRNDPGMRLALKMSGIDTGVSLVGALFINCSILILAGSAMYDASKPVDEVSLETAPSLIASTVGSSTAAVLFGVALLLAGQASTIASTLAGQIVMEGFLNLRVAPWVRRLVTRGLAIVPAFIILSITGDTGVEYVLMVSQVVLSLQLGFAVIPLVRFTADPDMMGPFANGRFLRYLSWVCAAAVVGLNVVMLGQVIFSGSAL